MYADVRHEQARPIRCLKTFESNVLATLELDEVLDAVKKYPSAQDKNRLSADLPADQGQSSVFIPLAGVASAQPTIFREDSLVIVEVLALVVATSNGCASDENLTLGWVVG